MHSNTTQYSDVHQNSNNGKVQVSKLRYHCLYTVKSSRRCDSVLRHSAGAALGGGKAAFLHPEIVMIIMKGGV